MLRREAVCLPVVQNYKKIFNFAYRITLRRNRTVPGVQNFHQMENLRDIEVTRIESLDDSRIKVYSRLTEAQLCDGLHTSERIFIAESPKVILTALEAGYKPLSLLCEDRHICGDAAPILERVPGLPVYTGDRDLLAGITGYRLTRGVLCAMRRPELPTVSQVCAGAGRVVVIDGVCDTTNIGSIFRSAAALGIDGVLLTPGSCDPLNRRAVRVSMGSVFLIPWTWLDSGIASLRGLGFKTVAMALRQNSVRLDNPALTAEPRLAIIMGTEGDGLADETIAGADYTVCIPMHHGVDSLNVAAASAVAFYALT